MATVKEHYAEVLSDIYSWMFGGLKVESNVMLSLLMHTNWLPEDLEWPLTSVRGVVFNQFL